MKHGLTHTLGMIALGVAGFAVGPADADTSQRDRITRPRRGIRRYPLRRGSLCCRTGSMDLTRRVRQSWTVKPGWCGRDRPARAMIHGSRLIPSVAPPPRVVVSGGDSRRSTSYSVSGIPVRSQPRSCPPAIPLPSSLRTIGRPIPLPPIRQTHGSCDSAPTPVLSWKTRDCKSCGGVCAAGKALTLSESNCL